MDKLKIILDFFKKYLFWFLFVATVVLVLVFWWMSTASLAKSFLQQQAKIKKKFNEVETIVNDPQHPTQDYIKAINDKHQKLKEGVLAVWETLYDAQKKNTPWPAVLGDKFIEKVSKLGPNDAIPPELRERYQNGIKKYFPILEKIIDLRQPSETAETGGGGGNAEPPRRIMGIRIPPLGRRPAATPAADNADLVGVVDWDEGDRLRLKDRYDWKTRPDSDVIRLRQEDLWVYETLLRVIQKTNQDAAGKDATEHSQANVKRIEWIQIGADAINSWLAADQSVFKAAEAAPGAQGQAPASHDTRAAPTARDTAATQDGKEQLLKDRYVDDKGVALEADAKQPYSSEFKMMPISMKLHMDQRKISKLLVECVNSPMPIEVRRVRIRPGKGEILDSGTSGTANPAGPGRDYSRRTMDARVSARSAGAGEGTDEGETGPYDIPVEIQGIIYIYNQPDQDTLGTVTAAEKPAETTP
jgi:hypothetical protein